MYGTFALVVALLIWIQIGSIDQETFDDRGLLAELKPVPDAENGFLDIAYMGDEKFRISGDESLKDFSQGKKWDSGKVETMLLANKNVIDSVIASNKKPLFKLPDTKGDVFNLFPYSALWKANNLLLVQSRRYANNLDFDLAIKSLKESIIFSEHVKSEENGKMISWAMGCVMQMASLSWRHEMVLHYELSSRQYSEILSLLREISPYSNDGMGKVASGEFLFAKEFIFLAGNRSIKERFEYFKKIYSYDNKDENIKTKSYFFLTTMLPYYYMHEKKTLGIVADAYSRMGSEAGRYCNGVRKPENEDDVNFEGQPTSWLDFITPNSEGLRYDSANNLTDVFFPFFERRCFYHVYVDAIKTAVAIKAYEKNNNNTLPETLNKLVPDYLDRLPIDYFNGEALRYSRENKWLYSVGADCKDDGGSLDGFYQGRCDKDKPCFNNPTVPLVLQQDR